MPPASGRRRWPSWSSPPARSRRIPWSIPAFSPPLIFSVSARALHQPPNVLEHAPARLDAIADGAHDQVDLLVGLGEFLEELEAAAGVLGIRLFMHRVEHRLLGRQAVVADHRLGDAFREARH